jgi:hypothetical protein
MSSHDPVNHPKHYNTGSIECIEAIEASMSPLELKGYLKGNVLKYLWRYNYKEKPREDIQKCLWYLEKLDKVLEKELPCPKQDTPVQNAE